ncbi:MAG: type II toxin-antitoxin system VapC family toxin [Pseudomonadota bacterium]|nr:type II toxin-antitoxin system VapC family toxin [Pseudomonadota bacterium]
MFLIDTNVISEARKTERANPGVVAFFREVESDQASAFLSAVTIGELRRGVELIRHRGDHAQAQLLEAWLGDLAREYQDRVLSFDADAAQIWGRLSAPNPQHAIDKQIAATALLYDLILVTRNVADFEGTGVKLRNPFVEK